MDILKNMYLAFEKHLHDSAASGNPASLYEPVNYLMRLGGKRIRPISLLLGYHVFRPDWEKALDQALALEMFHNFTLAHDDIMDEALLRRGKPTMHAAYDVNRAILAGDLMLIMSYQLLCGDGSHPALASVLHTFSQGAREICEGQQLDMEFEKRLDVTPEEYEWMIRLKTAVLLGVSMKIGALWAGASDKEAEALYQFAVNLGLAFQIQDDWLDTFGDDEKVGKKKGGDILRNKKTFLWTTCMERSEEADKRLLEAMVQEEDEQIKIDRVTELYLKYQVGALSKERQEYFFEQSMAALDALPGNTDTSQMRQFARIVMDRHF
jgi:geranylgeranyl diphosphate synthase, type II